MNRAPLRPYLVLFSSVAILSTASILIRLAQAEGIPSLIIASGRLGLAVLLLTPLAWSRAGAEIRGLGRRDVLLALLSGVFLGVHFAAWITSLAFTSVASSTAFVTTTPLWVGVASYVLFGERVSRGMLIGIALTVFGGLLTALSESGSSVGANPLLGDALALFGAICATAYFLIGRDLRRRLSTLAYTWLAFGTAAVLLTVAAASSGKPFLGYEPSSYIWLVALAIGPQLIGHTAVNWALRHLTATLIAVAILGEPIGSSLLALALFDETFTGLQLVGLFFLFCGILTAILGATRTADE